MRRKIVSLVLAYLLFSSVSVPKVVATLRTQVDAQFAERVKAGVAKLGVGPEAHVEVKLLDGTSAIGYVSEANESGFVVIDPKTRLTVNVVYLRVAKVKGSNTKTGEKISISAAKVPSSGHKHFIETALMIGGLATVVIILAVSIHAIGQH